MSRADTSAGSAGRRGEDWGAPRPPDRGPRLAAAAGAGTVIGGAALGGAAGPLPAALVVVATGGALAAAARAQPRLVLRRLRARPCGDARLRNIVTGIAERAGRPAPRLYEADGPANAFALPGGPGCVVVATSLLGGSSRTELEAVAAGCMIRLARSTWALRLTAVLRPLARLASPLVDLDADVAAVALTRYPPALAAALERAEPPPAFAAPFAFVTFPPWGRRREERLEIVRDL